MVGVVVMARRFHINPDNVATPIAASLGDLTTISLLAAVSRALYSLIDDEDCSIDCSKLMDLVLWWKNFFRVCNWIFCPFVPMVFRVHFAS